MTNINFESIKQIDKVIDYISLFDSIFLVNIILDNRNVSIEELYKYVKYKLDNKLVVITYLNKSYGGIDLIDYIPKKNNNPYIISELKFNSGQADELINFKNSEYIGLATHGMIGYFYSSLNHPNDGILTPNYSKRAHNSKLLIKK